VSRAAIALAVVLAAAVACAAADKSDKKAVKGTVEEAARTGGHAARDGALTFGRSVKAFFHGGPTAAKKTWKANAAKTKRDAKQGAAATKAAAK
jgi:hypothetical protein